ncbi:hypothetical protein [Pseudomonas panipatensis]|jgi:hypothetical protein|uniref:Lipoprotein n=1 Tax=Pseudomonas panipatensis TaxID=428992 RepID=A0A1G8CBI4_9PSED|nr:hypothetical protein [Pseudomonas panipatensis]SDH42804.1 hypothetical protein SAMN05216272_101494 [Pseudomonas panipatensis]SMP65719.1 hypothetical protein SAMN06295951_10722 [Pseudomonas panipatensis]
MPRSFSLLTLALPVLLLGCAAQPPHEDDARAYSNSEVKAFALKMLGGSKLSDDYYAKYRRALTEDHDAAARKSGS